MCWCSLLLRSAASLLEGRDVGQLLLSGGGSGGPATGGAAAAAGGAAGGKAEEKAKEKEKEKSEESEQGDMGFSLFD